MKIINCKTNHLQNPLGYKMDKAVFSYQVSEAVGKKQTQARICISLKQDMSDLIYDSGFDPSIDSFAYTADIVLTPRTRFYWNVTVRSDAGEEAVSETNWFETGKMDEAWTARFITCDSSFERHPIFKKDIAVSEELKEARLYICGLGLYEASINGSKISDEYLTPYCNNYNQWLQYQTYDVTDMLKGGGQLEVLLGNGWYKGRFEFGKSAQSEPYYGKTWKLLAEVRLKYTSGKEEVIVTDESWQVRHGKITASSIYDGEELDATLTDTEPYAASICEESTQKLTERLSTPVTVHEELAAIELIHTPAGEMVLDLGQNIAGIFRLRVNEPVGKKVYLQFGEILQNGNFYRENLRSAKAEYTYISDGKEFFVIPTFTFYGYRFVKVTGIDNLKKEDFTGLALYSKLPLAGTLTTGNELVNKLIKNTEWGLKGNFIDVPTDCPQRDERMGWTGDAQVFSPTACFLRDSYAFYKKYLYDISTEQRDTKGAVPFIIPSFTMKDACCVWGDAACIIPWNVYLFYGDKSILQDQYESMKQWVDYITSVDGDNNNWRNVFHFGDWLALDNPYGGVDKVFGGTDVGFIAGIYYAHSANLVSKAAKVLGKADDANQYKELSDRVLKGVREEYYSVTGRCCINTQTALLLTLYFNILESPDRTREALRDLFKKNDDKLQTGFVGTPLLCNILSENGMNDLAYDLLLNEEYPGWLYGVKLGATTIWERWNSVLPDGSISSTGMNSLNHYAYGSIVEWIFRHAAGINPIEDSPGFRRVRLIPKPEKRLNHLEAEYNTPGGTYKSAWKMLDEKNIELQFTVPFGCEAELVLPFAPDSVFLDKDNPLFSNVTNGVCYLTAGEYKVAYEIA